LLDEQHDERLQREIDDEISAAITEVERHGPPPRDSLFDDVFEKLPWHLLDQRRELLELDAAPVR
jgi:TPP-dependent pyruvate/acetoin dehydrogenase alpha subunit